MAYEETLKNAFKRCEEYEKSYGDSVRREQGRNFLTLYPFTTELISSYIDYFDLQGKSLLTVGSSADQAINAALKGARDITVIDINPFIRYYYYLKVAAILALNRDEFYRYLCYFDYPTVGERYMQTFSKALYTKVKLELMKLDYESYMFWDTLYKNFSPYTIRRSVFNEDEGQPQIISIKNRYLDKESYQETRRIIADVDIKFENQDVTRAKMDRKFDNIWLSNIIDYLTSEERTLMFNAMEALLEEGGKMLIAYIYSVEDVTSHFNLSTLEKAFGGHSFENLEFRGVSGILRHNEKKDSVLIYTR